MTPLAQALNAALLHFVWQGIVIGFLLWIALFLLRRSSASVRYAVSCGAMLLLALAPVVTASLTYTPGAEVVGSRQTFSGFGVTQTTGVSESVPAAGWPGFQAWEEWILPSWGLGVVLFALRLIWCWGHTSALRRTGIPADERFVVMVWNVAERIGVTRKVRVLMSSLAEVPSVIGWVRPVLLLPVAVATGLTPEQLEALITHELAHVRRHDYFVNLVQTVVETILFYHPAVWWVSSRIRYERELCCDDIAVATLGDATRYARALARLEEVRILRPTLAMGAARGPLFLRIERLLGGDGQQQAPSRVACAVGLVIGVTCLALNMSWAQGRTRNNGPIVEDFSASLPPAVSVVPKLPEIPQTPEPPVPPLTPLSAQVSPLIEPSRVERLAQGDVPWVAFMKRPLLRDDGSVQWVDRIVLSGSPADEAEARAVRQSAGNGDALWFKLQGKGYLTQDKAIIERIMESNTEISRFRNLQLAGTMDFFLEEKNKAAESLAELQKRQVLQANLLADLPALKAQVPTSQDLNALREEIERLRQSLPEMTAKLQQYEALQAKLESALRAGAEQKLRQEEALRQFLPQLPDVLRDAINSGKAQPAK